MQYSSFTSTFYFLIFLYDIQFFGLDKKAFGEEEKTKKINEKESFFYKESNTTFLEHVSKIHYENRTIRKHRYKNQLFGKYRDL